MGRLIEIKGSFGLRRVWILFGLLEQLVEFSFEHLVMALMVFKGLVENLGPPCLFTLEFLDRRANILDDWGLLVLLKADHCFQFGINLKGRLATWASNFNQLTFPFTHTKS